MKIFYALILLLSMSLPIQAAEEKKEIVIVADEWCPFNCYPTSKKPGYVVELAKIIFAKHGIEVKYEIVPWVRALQGTADGDYNAAICASKNEGKALLFPDEMVGISRNKFYVRSDSSWVYTDEKSLEAVSFGVIADYSYGEVFDNYMKQNKDDNTKIQIATGDNAIELNLKKLVNKRIDATYDNEFVARYEINELGYNGKVKEAGQISTPISPRDDYYYLAFSPKKPESAKYAKIFSDGIREMRKSGELEEIMHKYGLHDWKYND